MPYLQILSGLVLCLRKSGAGRCALPPCKQPVPTRPLIPPECIRASGQGGFAQRAYIRAPRARSIRMRPQRERHRASSAAGPRPVRASSAERTSSIVVCPGHAWKGGGTPSHGEISTSAELQATAKFKWVERQATAKFKWVGTPSQSKFEWVGTPSHGEIQIA